MRTCQKSRDRLVESAARRVAPQTRAMDQTGRDRDDYQQLLAMKAWEAMDKVPDHGKDIAQRWRYAVVWNQLRDFQRELGWQPQVMRYDMLEEERRHAPSFEKLMEQRDALQKLEAYLTPREARLLVAYVVQGCNIRRLWEDMEKPCCYRHFCRRVEAVRAKCRRFFRANCPELGPKIGRASL